MATISIDAKELSQLREMLATAKYDCERHIAVSIALRDRLEKLDEAPTEYYLSTLLVEGDAGISGLIRMQKYLDKLDQSLATQAA